MNGAVYISFFQGQLESVLEQVVQLAVQEISKTVGSGLNTLLLETAVKEQENRRLRHQLQAWESRAKSGDGPADGTASTPAKSKSERPDGKSPERQQQQQQQQWQQQQHHGGPGGGAGAPACLLTDTRRREQRRRAVDQLKTVMAQVLDFAQRELTKIVEASFDDLLLEVTKMETEQQGLEERLGRSAGRAGGGARGGEGGRRRGSENDSVSPSDSEDAREELPAAAKEAEDAAERPPSLLPAQDWVPILDKVFGQRWCSQIQDLEGDGPGEAEQQQVEPLLPAPPLSLEPSPSSPQQDPRWTPLEDMEVFSPDEEAGDTRRGGGAGGESAGGRSSASMLHRLLTLPSQLLEDDANAAAAAQKDAAAAAAPPPPLPASRSILPPLKIRVEEEEEELEEEGEEEWEERGKKKKRRRVWSECEECGRRFSRMSLLKAHRQTHNDESSAAAAAATEDNSPPPGGNTLALRCSQCGKRFSSATRLHSHVRTQHLEESHLT